MLLPRLSPPIARSHLCVPDIVICSPWGVRVCCCSCRSGHLWSPPPIGVSLTVGVANHRRVCCCCCSCRHCSSLAPISITQIPLIQYHSPLNTFNIAHTHTPHSTHAPHLKHIIPRSNHSLNTFNSSHASLSPT